MKWIEGSVSVSLAEPFLWIALVFSEDESMIKCFSTLWIRFYCVRLEDQQRHTLWFYLVLVRHLACDPAAVEKKIYCHYSSFWGTQHIFAFPDSTLGSCAGWIRGSVLDIQEGDLPERHQLWVFLCCRLSAALRLHAGTDRAERQGRTDSGHSSSQHHTVLIRSLITQENETPGEKRGERMRVSGEGSSFKWQRSEIDPLTPQCHCHHSLTSHRLHYPTCADGGS